MTNGLISKRARALRDFLDACVQHRREFLLKNLEEKLKKLKSTPDANSKKKRKDIEKMKRSLILSEGAKAAQSVQMATHIAKATYPSANVRLVTNLLCIDIDEFPQHKEVGTHSLRASDIVVDATHSAADNKKAYEVYLLLRSEFEGKTILQMLEEGDVDAIAALDDDENVAKDLANKLVKINEPKCRLPASHPRMKQVYWLAGENATRDNEYCLFSPLFATSLARIVHTDISNAFSDEANVAARRSRWKEENKPQEGTTYRDYPNIGVRKLGGETSKKQLNISQLNSERHGFNYLLASLPPCWQEQPKSFLNIVSVFGQFCYYDNVPSLVNRLCRLLAGNPQKTMRILHRQKQIEQALWWLLANFGLEIQERHLPGWTRDVDCKLTRCEQLWLDPGRAYLPAHTDHEEADRDFAREFERKDWLDEIATLSAKWLDKILCKANLPIEDIEFRHWEKQARQAIAKVTDRPATLKRRAKLDHISGESAHG
ncbi:MAG: type I-F CRISPR-associated protein Csy1 [Azoarcus sp.]|jgi:CRISPR-associated protein Csy1|nr:type I-F CRISPR-associated protein Csy1 [Azoarcus sp.]